MIARNEGDGAAPYESRAGGQGGATAPVALTQGNNSNEMGGSDGIG
jgi:hypothetical protein